MASPGQNQFRHHVGVTYVAVEDEAILGYATVAPAAIEIDLLPDALRKGLPRYPLPVLRLARLAVDSRVRGRGLGEELLRFVFGLALKLTSDYGCVGVVVDAKPDAVVLLLTLWLRSHRAHGGRFGRPAAANADVLARERADGGAPRAREAAGALSLSTWRI